MIPALPRANIAPIYAPQTAVQQPVVQPAAKPMVQQPIVKTTVQATAPPLDLITIMCFVWNADGLRLCETMSQSRANQSRTGLRSFISRRPPCIAPDFFEEIRSIIYNLQPSLVVMVTEDEAQNGTYFHSDLLPNVLPELNYFLLNRDTFTSTPNTVRISIYAQENVAPTLTAKNNVSTCQDSAAVATYVTHPTYGKFAFVALNLSGNHQAIGMDDDYQARRTATQAANLLCLLKIYNELITPEQPDHIFLLGDFGYDIVIPERTPDAIITSITSDITAARLKDLQRFDDLRNAMKYYPLLGFKEGISGEGPIFLPTWKLARNRSSQCVPRSTTPRINRDCFDDSFGWHNRILYKEMLTSPYMTHCFDYNRIDIKNMHESNHAGVLAFFEIR